MASRQAWYEADQGVVVRRPRNDDEAAAEIVHALEHGWTILSHNVVKSPWLFIGILFIGRLVGRAEHVITFMKTPPSA